MAVHIKNRRGYDNISKQQVLKKLPSAVFKYDDSSYDDSSYDDGSYDDGSYDDSSYDDTGDYDSEE